MQTQRKLTHVVVAGLIFFAGVMSAHTWLATPPANAQGNAQSPKQDPKAPQAFLAEDERMEPVVREMLATMKRMDQRLENIEKSLTSSKKSAADGAENSTRTRPR